jgi:small basic protein
MNFYEQLLLAMGGYTIHILKMWLESIKRNEKFNKETFLISIAINVISIVLLVYIGGSLPSDLLVMSPMTCVMIGTFNSSMLSGFINVKKPKDINETE